jgi:transcription antitermination protein NusB
VNDTSDDPFAPDAAGRRREARERAIELLYEAQLKHVEVGAVIEAEMIRPDPFAIALAEGVSAEVTRLDDELAELLHEGWSISRLAILDLWILRLGLHELDRGDAPVAVVINEAVELATAYGATDESGRFVNGVLAAAAKR